MTFRFSIPVEIRFRDMDAMGHVNNAVYLTYLEIARTAYMQQMIGFRTLQEINFVLARVEFDYRHGAVFGQTLKVECGAVRLGRTSFTLRYRITADEGRILIGEALTVLAWFDYAAARVLPFPEEVRARMQAYDSALLQEGLNQDAGN
jgi:acyl-CoA thioester hydrolase